MCDPSARRAVPQKQQLLLPAALIVVTGVVIYANSFAAPFVFDGLLRIEGNPAIRRLWPPAGWLTYDTRPVALFTFALNYALGRFDVWGYHAVNLAIHIGAALALFGIVRRTLRTERLAARFGNDATPLALAVALLWMVHPLQTQSVTYVVQRIEALMGLWFLLTLYAFVRAQEAARPAWWYALSVVCCALGTATKEVMVLAPVLVLWYDRVFVARQWSEVLARRKAYYAALFSTWGLLGFLMISRWDTYTGSAGSVQGISSWEYALSQPGVIVHYLQLCFWPVGQCLDYAWPIARTAGEIVPPAIVLVLLLGATVWCIGRCPPWGFVGAWFLLILAPTSSIVPVRDLAFEHRMYLPLAAIVVVVVVGGWQCIRGVTGDRENTFRWARGWWFAVLAVAAVLLGHRTVERNAVYRSRESVWRDVIEKAPHNSRAYSNLGHALQEQGRLEEAAALHQKSIQLNAENPVAYCNLGLIRQLQGRLDDAAEFYRQALAIDPDYPVAHDGLGCALMGQQRLEEAIGCFREALRLRPDFAAAYNNWAQGLMDAERTDEALDVLSQALAVAPDHPPTHSQMGMVLAKRGRYEEALAHHRQAVAIDPDYALAHFNLANLLYRLQHFADAIVHYRRAIELDPQYAKAHYNLGNLYRDLGRYDDAIAEYRQTLVADPRHAAAHNNWGVVLQQQGRFQEAIGHFEAALEIDPNNPAARENLRRARES